MSALDPLLPEAARLTLARVSEMPASYAVAYLLSPDRRLVVAIGEVHIKLAEASALGRELVGHFALRGVETFPVRKVVGGRALGLLIHLPRLLLQRLSFGLVKGSTITDAKALPTGRTFELEQSSPIPLGLHVASVYLGFFFLIFWAHLALTIAHSLSLPVDDALAHLTRVARLLSFHMPFLVLASLLRRWSWSWLVHPAIAILTLRDTIMAEGTIAMLREAPEPPAAIVIMGRAHLSGYAHELVEKHGFSLVT